MYCRLLPFLRFISIMLFCLWSWLVVVISVSLKMLNIYWFHLFCAWWYYNVCGAEWILQSSMLWLWRLWGELVQGVKWLRWELSFWMIKTDSLWGMLRDLLGKVISSLFSSLREKPGDFVRLLHTQFNNDVCVAFYCCCRSSSLRFVCLTILNVRM